jgi:hypothetical protein
MGSWSLVPTGGAKSARFQTCARLLCGIWTLLYSGALVSGCTPGYGRIVVLRSGESAATFLGVAASLPMLILNDLKTSLRLASRGQDPTTP